MKIAVVGVGAMGSVYAGLLAKAGNEVWAIDVSHKHIEAIQAHGLRVEGASGDHTIRLNATVDAEKAGPCDLVILATKAMQVEAASQSAKPLIGKNTTVLTIQNGIGSSEKVAALLGEERVTVGVAGGFGASIKAPGHVHHNGMELIRLGEMNGPVSRRVKDVTAVWSSAGFNAKACDDIQQMIWEKLICNVCYSGVCTVSESRIGEVLNDEGLWQIAKGCAREAYQVAMAKGIKVDIDEPVSYVRAFGENMPNAKPSMLLDHMAGRPSEIEAINGAIVREGANTNVPTIFNEIMTALIIAKEKSDDMR
ncbi:uncharacterized protein METZ01_LOCUS194107 [marine metagenome]|uniref:2-dehydropantoate 2-reductase n=1 Tax=marine metagenome TaxID=408172 RepID=A0A382DUB1_9ZZZZ